MKSSIVLGGGFGDEAKGSFTNYLCKNIKIMMKEATIKRSMADQIVGVSSLTLAVLGDDNNETSANETEIILPALSKNIAIEIQDIILKKAQVEDFNMEPENKL